MAQVYVQTQGRLLFLHPILIIAAPLFWPSDNMILSQE